MGIIEEIKAFALRGDVVDLAVGGIIGGAMDEGDPQRLLLMGLKHFTKGELFNAKPPALLEANDCSL